jgi:hypothetical protein
LDKDQARKGNKEETILDEEVDIKEREIVQEPEIIFIAKISR